MNDETSPDLVSALRHRLLALATQQERFATQAAAAVPYWVACPPEVTGHRAAAAALRRLADGTAQGSLR